MNWPRNASGNARDNFGAPQADRYVEPFNSDSRYSGGSDTGNGGMLLAREQPWRDWPASFVLAPPPEGVVIQAG